MYVLAKFSYYNYCTADADEKPYEKDRKDVRRQESTDEDTLPYQVSYEARER